MFIKKLFFPGTFDEAFIYKQKLLLMNEEGELFYIDLDYVCDELDKYVSGDFRFIPKLLFSESQLLNEPQVRAIRANTRVNQAIRSALNDWPDEYLVDSKYIIRVGNTGIISPLDLHIYYDRVYVGADEGLFSFDLDIQTNWTNVNLYSTEKRHDALTMAISVSLGSINASCAEEGLFTTFGEFGRRPAPFWTGEFIRSSNRSLRTDQLFKNLINYRTSTDLDYMVFSRTADEKKKSKEASQVKETQVTGYEKTETLASATTFGSNIISLFNTKKFLLVQDIELKVTQRKFTRKSSTGEITTQSQQLTPFKDSRIVSVKSLQDYAVVECYDKVYVVTANEVVQILDAEALSVRTYPESKRVKHLTTIVVEDGVYLVSLLDEV